jgi:DNA transposition AAA+ family ATPase
MTPISNKKLRTLKMRNLPPSEVVRASVRKYLAESSMTIMDFAHRVGYERISIDLFLGNKITHNDMAIRAACLDFMDAHPIEPITSADGKLYGTKNVELIRHCFNRALAQRCAYYFRGAPGCQKTFVLEHLIADLNRSEIARKGNQRAYYVRCRIAIRPGDLMKRVARAAGCISAGGVDRIISNLRHDFRDKQVLLVFDEAQFLSILCLETLRELLDTGMVGLLFAGSHQLEDTFDRLDMAQWRSRIRKGSGLPGLSEDEAQHILRAELPKMSDRSMHATISRCYENDYYRGQKLKYISARLLFFSIEEVKLRKQEQASHLSESEMVI